MTFLKPKFKTRHLSGVLTCCFCGNLCCDTHENKEHHSNNADCEDENDRCCLKCNDGMDGIGTKESTTVVDILRRNNAVNAVVNFIFFNGLFLVL